MSGPQEAAAGAVAVRRHLDRIRRHERPVWRSRRRLRFALARTRWQLELRDDAYRRLLAVNARLEADRRFAEAADAILANYRSNPVNGLDVDTLIDRLEERNVDHACHTDGG